MVSKIIASELKKLGINATPGLGKGKHPAVFYSVMDGTINRVSTQQAELRIVDSNYDQLIQIKEKIIKVFHVYSNDSNKRFKKTVYRCKVFDGGTFWNDEAFDCTLYLQFRYVEK